MRPTHRHRRTFCEPGHAHSLPFSCYHGYHFLAAEGTCRWLADAIDAARKKFEFQLWAYVFMPNHAHLVVLPSRERDDIAAIRTAIKSPVAKRAIKFLEEREPAWLPRITRRRGQKVERLFWQSGGGYDRNLDQPSTLLGNIDYIHMNPVRRGLAQSATDWKWSSARWFAGRKGTLLLPDPIPPDWLD
jgi:putative transposase